MKIFLVFLLICTVKSKSETVKYVKGGVQPKTDGPCHGGWTLGHSDDCAYLCRDFDAIERIMKPGSQGTFCMDWANREGKCDAKGRCRAEDQQTEPPMPQPNPPGPCRNRYVLESSDECSYLCFDHDVFDIIPKEGSQGIRCTRLDRTVGNCNSIGDCVPVDQQQDQVPVKGIDEQPQVQVLVKSVEQQDQLPVKGGDEQPQVQVQVKSVEQPQVQVQVKSVEQPQDQVPVKCGDEQQQEQAPVKGGDEQHQDQIPVKVVHEQQQDHVPVKGSDEQQEDQVPVKGSDEQQEEKIPVKGSNEQQEDQIPVKSSDEQQEDQVPV